MKKSFVAKALCLFMASVLMLGFFPMSAKASADPVYDSMVEPSESYIGSKIDSWHKYGHIMHPTPPDGAEKVLSMGDLYKAYGEELPDKFTVYLGKIKCFAYSRSEGRWLCIDSQPYPTGIYLYELPWSTNRHKNCKKITYTDTYAKIELTADEMKSHCLHFWGRPAVIDKEDFLFYACAFDFWVDEAGAGKLTMRNGVDYKDKTGGFTIKQVYTSRCMSASTQPKTHWGHSVPVEDYNKYNTSSLNDLYASNEVTEISDKLTVPRIKKVMAGEKSAKLKLKRKAKGATGYQIQYSTNKKFKKNVVTTTVKKGRKKSLKIKHLKANKKYYVRVRAYKKEGSKTIYSRWSRKKSVTTK